MSHFTVLVIGQDPERQLAPFHQYECTGTNDQYVQDVDITDEFMKDYNSATISYAKGPANQVLDPATLESYKEELLHHPTHGLVIRRWSQFFETIDPDDKWQKDYDLPEGWEQIEIPVNECMFLMEYVEYCHGSVTMLKHDEEYTSEKMEGVYTWGREDGNGHLAKLYSRTNPNAKWDWYKIGGRWTGFFKMKPRTQGIKGTPGLMTDPAKDGYADQAFKCDIDFQGMRDEAESKAAEQYDTVVEACGRQPEHRTWDEIREAHLEHDGIDKAREIYWAQPDVKAISEIKGRWFEADDFRCSRKEYIKDAGDSCLHTFAVLKDGKWYERGEMCMFAHVDGDKGDAWTDEFNALLRDLDDMTLFTLVDCHI